MLCPSIYRGSGSMIFKLHERVVYLDDLGRLVGCPGTVTSSAAGIGVSVRFDDGEYREFGSHPIHLARLEDYVKTQKEPAPEGYSETGS